MGRLLLDSEHRTRGEEGGGGGGARLCGCVLGSSHDRCHKAFPVYDLMLTTLLVMPLGQFWTE